ncbi:MAG: hypothetical protein ACKVZJ_14260 [Phycisphaerales bacterium]
MSDPLLSAPAASSSPAPSIKRHPGPCEALCREKGWGLGTMLEGFTASDYDVVQITGFDAEGGALVLHWTDDTVQAAPTVPKFFPLLYRNWQPLVDPVSFPTT